VVIVRRRRGPPVFPLVVMIVVTLLTIALTYGNNRFRASAETALAVLAAVAVDAAWRRLRSTRAPSTDGAGTPEPAPGPGDPADPVVPPEGRPAGPVRPA
jgi:uncharacterized membrane protein YoaK (UPF0700 family)